jgi:CheY-like chemotaxis protein
LLRRVTRELKRVICNRENMGSAILVVDDETDSADLLGMILEMQVPNAVVRIAYGGQAALKLATQSRPDAAVIDLEMPELDGEQLAVALRALFPDAVPLLIALSGNVGRLAAMSGKGTFDHHMSKPADLDGLVRLLGQV